MRASLKTGLSFGITSGIITTLGLIVGLNAGTHSKIAVIGGIFTIAIADSFSDALGIHVSQEAQKGISVRSVWEATLAALIAKFIFATTFVIPILVFELNLAVAISVVWGFIVLTSFNYYIAKQRDINPLKLVREHLFIGALVILISKFVGNWVASALS